MTKTLINGKWVYDPIKDYSNGKTAQTQNQRNCELIQAQKDHMVQGLQAIAQCKSITDVRKVMTHLRATYPTKL